MKVHQRCLLLLILLGATMAHAQAPTFQHIVIVFQENRTPDNLFGSNPTFVPGVDIHGNDTFKAPDCDGSTNGIPLQAANLVTCYDLGHWHVSFNLMWNNGNMNGACNIQIISTNCSVPTCQVHMNHHTHCPQFQYVDNSAKMVQPYFDIATYYGFANYMFQTNQGPSFPAHQFILSGTSAPDLPNQAFGAWFAAENQVGSNVTGCIAPLGVTVNGIDPTGTEDQNWYQPPWVNSGFPCYEHQTLTDLLDTHGIGWKYYAPVQGSLWTAPNAIYHMCQPSQAGGNCTNPANWGSNGHVVLETNPLAPVFADLKNCTLPAVSWVIPDGRWSDHAGVGANGNTGLGPAYVAAIVNAIGGGVAGSTCNSPSDPRYWTKEPTLILIAWDDWGGWYDHVKPPAPFRNQYELGFRVPLLVVSAYTGTDQAGYVSGPISGDGSTCSNPLYCFDFGSILQFIENNFGLGSIGGLTANYADAQAVQLDPGFFNINTRHFKSIPLPPVYSGYDANYFGSQTGTPQDPDNDATETPD